MAPLAAMSGDSDSGQITEFATGHGQIVGTVAYMSPEQTRGRPADARSDVFSLGVTLYEMITGRQPFVGDSPVSVMSAILLTDPKPVRVYRTGLPNQLQRILDGCLAKDPSRRYQDVLDLRNALESLRAEGDAQDGAATEESRSPKTLLGRAAALLIIGAAIGGGGVVALRSAFPGAKLTVIATRANFEITPLVASHVIMPAGPTFSPSGLEVVYAAEIDGQRDLWKLQIDGGASVRLTDTPEAEVAPAWSPDGQTIAYCVESGSSAGIYLVAADGGNSTLLREQGLRPSWSPDGSSIAFEWRGTVAVVPVYAVGNPVTVIENLGGDAHPVWSPEGTALFVWSESHLDVLRVPIGGGSSQPLGLVPSGEEVVGMAVQGNGEGLILARGQFGGNKSLWFVPLHADSGAVVGQPVRLTFPLTDNTDVTVSTDGSRIAFVAGHIERHLYSVSIDPISGLQVQGRVPERLTSQADINYYPVLSRDGRKLAWTAHRRGAGFIYQRDVGTTDEEKLTPLWELSAREIGADFVSPDAESVVYSSTEGGGTGSGGSSARTVLACP